MRRSVLRTPALRLRHTFFVDGIGLAGRVLVSNGLLAARMSYFSNSPPFIIE